MINEIKTNLFWKMNEQLSHRSTYDVWLNIQRNVAIIISDEIFDELFYSVKKILNLQRRQHKSLLDLH